MILSGIAVPPTQQQSICVKYIYVDLLQEEGEKELSKLEFEDVDQFCYCQTFKLYQNTTFDDLKFAACQFWNAKDLDTWVLTDEYFNLLSTYKDTIQNFFEESAGYQPLNSQVHACVFLMRKKPDKKCIHMLQLESVEL